MNILINNIDPKLSVITLQSGKTQSVSALDRLPKRTYEVVYEKKDTVSERQEMLRRCADEVCSMLHKDKVSEVCLDASKTDAADVMAFLEGLQLADYTFDRYKSKSREHVATVTVKSGLISQEMLDEQLNVWNRIFWCREWVNLPVADLNAEQFADELADIAKDLGVACTVFGKKKIESLGMGGLTAVNKGSVDEPRFVVLEYCPKSLSKSKPIALIGKGIMYDTGGLNIKPDDYMQEMKSDMAGAATMASVVFAAADNQLPVHLVACLPLTDSRPSFNAYAADDVLTMYDGTTVEVINTDAEGRIILADAIAYAVANYNPQLVVDAATLTGAAVRAISTYGIAAMQQHADKPMQKLKQVGEEVYERIAEFPFWKEYDELIESDIADIKNCGIAQAGTITAGKFLAHFAKEVPYIHLDIAGVAFFSKKQFYYAKGGSGYGVRLLYNFLKSNK